MNIQPIAPQTAYNAAKRSLRFVLILSAIGSGYMLLSTLIMTFFLPMMNQLMLTQGSAIPDEMQVALELALKAPRGYYAISAVLYALSLTGVILMWKMHRNGLHCYTLAQLLLLIIPVAFLGKEFLALGDVMFTIFFVGYYFIAFRGIESLQSQLASNEDASEPVEPSEQDSLEDDSSIEEN